jgi:hypothetical protein
MDGRLDAIDARDPRALAVIAPVDILAACRSARGERCPLLPGGEPNSVAIHGRLMTVAVANAVRTDNGHAVFFPLRRAVRHVGFERFDDPKRRAALEGDGVRIFGPGANVSQDLEPEYVAVEGNTAYVSLQENNALAVVDLEDARIERIIGLGLNNHARPGGGLDGVVTIVPVLQPSYGSVGPWFQRHVVILAAAIVGREDITRRLEPGNRRGPTRRSAPAARSRLDPAVELGAYRAPFFHGPVIANVIPGPWMLAKSQSPFGL